MAEPAFIYGSSPAISEAFCVEVGTGTVVQSIVYDEYGIVESDNNPGFIPFGFAGGMYDHETELVRFGARDYDAESGRWTCKDPIGFKGGFNHYNYVNNKPDNFFDPFGLEETHTGWQTSQYSYKSSWNQTSITKSGSSYTIGYRYTCKLKADSKEINVSNPALLAHEQAHATIDMSFNSETKGNSTHSGCDLKSIKTGIDDAVAELCKSIFNERIKFIKQVHNWLDFLDGMPLSFPEEGL